MDFKYSDLIIGAMRFGKWGAKFSTTELEHFVDQCLDLGLVDFDHADIYGDFTTESDFGQVLKKRKDLAQKVRITTKCGILMPCENRPTYKVPAYDSSRKHILTSVDESLKNLNVEKIDVLLLHRPDYLLDPEEVADAFESLKKAGKVANFGVSNYTYSQFDLLNSYFPLITNQLEVSILELKAFNDGTLDQMLKHKLQTMVWSPMAGGRLFTETSEQTDRIKKIAAPICEKYNVGLDQLMFSWIHTHPARMASITGTTKFERIEKALEAIKIKLTKQEWYDIYQASTGEKIP